MNAPTEPDPSDTPRAVSALSPLQQPVFRQVWAASFVSNFGGMIQSVGASWTMISLGQPADMVALVQASVTLPIMLLSLVAGAMADNLDRRKVMLAAQTLHADDLGRAIGMRVDRRDHAVAAADRLRS